MKAEMFRFQKSEGWHPSPAASLDSDQTLVLVFGATEYLDAPAPIAELRRVFPHAHLVGCSTAGEIGGSSIADGSLSVAVARFEATSLLTATAAVSGADGSFEAGRALAERLNRPTLRSVLVLSDGLGVNGSDLVRGINGVVGDRAVVTGGLAGDGPRFQRTWVLADDRPQSGVISAIGFYGERLVVGHGSKGGWDKFGPERVITRSKGNVLYELDGRPALALYKQYLGERAAGLPAAGLLFPLAIRASSSDDKSLVRTILAVNEADQSMTFAGDVPQGHLAQLMKANFDRLIGGASEAALMAKDVGDGGGSDVLSIAISCVGRRIVLGERAEEELEAVADVLPENVKQVGFYSYGEISPYATGPCDLHNQTMTLTVLAER